MSQLCQHAYLASQSLQDVYDTLPCIFAASSSSAEGNPARMKPGCAVCVENVLYCDSLGYSKSVHLLGMRVMTDSRAIEKYLNTSQAQNGPR